MAIFQVPFFGATVRSCGTSGPGYDQTRPTGEIAPDCGVPIEAKPSPGKNPGHRLGLIGADLDENLAVWRQDLGSVGGDAAVGVEPVRAAVEGYPRIVACDLVGQAGDLGRRDIRRVGDDQVELAVDAVEPISGYKARAFCHAESLRVGFGKLERRGADIGANAARLW